MGCCMFPRLLCSVVNVLLLLVCSHLDVVMVPIMYQLMKEESLDFPSNGSVTY